MHVFLAASMQHLSKYTDMATGIFSQIHAGRYIFKWIGRYRYTGRWLSFGAGGRMKRTDDYGHTYVSCVCENAQVG